MEQHRSIFGSGILSQRCFGILGIPEEGSVDIMNVKCNPELNGFIARTYGIRPGYHMNKEHWISVVLDGSVGDGKTLDFLDMSYDLIDTGRK